MLQVRNASNRGRAGLGWLDSRHTFSFGDYYDPEHMGFGPLRVINEDRVQPGQGFGRHSHRDMEIISYVLEGAPEHKDSLGTGSVIRPGDVQRMSAGTGVQHSEFNHSQSELVHFLQIWIIPDQQGLRPGYAEKKFPEAEKCGRLKLVVSGDGRDGSMPIHQDADLYPRHRRCRSAALRPGVMPAPARLLPIALAAWLVVGGWPHPTMSCPRSAKPSGAAVDTDRYSS